MVFHQFSSHQNAAPYIDGKGIIDNTLGNSFDSINALHITISRIVYKNIYSTEPLQHRSIDLFDCILVRNVTFQYQILCIECLQFAFYLIGISRIGCEISVCAISIGFTCIKFPE